VRHVKRLMSACSIQTEPLVHLLADGVTDAPRRREAARLLAEHCDHETHLIERLLDAAQGADIGSELREEIVRRATVQRDGLAKLRSLSEAWSPSQGADDVELLAQTLNDLWEAESSLRTFNATERRPRS